MLLHILGVDPDGFAVAVRGGEGDFVQHPFHHRLQAPRSDILHRRVDGDRNIGERVLFGGGRNLDFKGEATTEHALTKRIQSKLDELLETMILPGTPYTVDVRWAGTMGVGAKKAPIVKKISGNVYCAVRMGGMGVALGSLTGEEAAEMVLAEL